MAGSNIAILFQNYIILSLNSANSVKTFREKSNKKYMRPYAESLNSVKTFREKSNKKYMRPYAYHNVISGF